MGNNAHGPAISVPAPDAEDQHGKPFVDAYLEPDLSLEDIRKGSIVFYTTPKVCAKFEEPKPKIVAHIHRTKTGGGPNNESETPHGIVEATIPHDGSPGVNISIYINELQENEPFRKSSRLLILPYIYIYKQELTKLQTN